MVDLIDGFTPYAGKDAEKYNRLRWWPGLTFGDILDRAADMFPDKVAFVDGDSCLTYAQTRCRWPTWDPPAAPPACRSWFLEPTMT